MVALRPPDRDDFEGGRRVLNEQLAKINELVQMVDDNEMIAEAKEISENLAFMAEHQYNKESRKQMSYSAYNQRRGRKNR